MSTPQEKIPEIIQKSLNKRKLFNEALFKRSESLASLLPYDEYLKEEKVFLMKDGSLGAVFEVTPLEHEPLTEKQVIQTANSLKFWLNLPSSFSLQLLFEQSAVSSRDQRFQEFQNACSDGHAVSKLLYEEKLKAVQKNCQDENINRPLDRKVYLSLRYHPHKKNKHLIKSWIEKGDALLYQELKVFVEELRVLKHQLRDLEYHSKLPLTRLNAEDLLRFLRKFFNPETYYKRDFASFNEGLSLSDQFIYNSPTLDHSGIQREGIKTKSISLKTSPQYAYPGGMAYFLSLPFPVRVSLSFSFPSKDKAKRFFDLKEFFLQNTPTAKARYQKEEVLEVQEKLARDDRCLQMTFTVIVEAKTDEELEERNRAITSIFHHELECEVIEEDEIGLGLCLNALPLCYMPDSDYSTQRFIRILRSDAIKLLPVFDSFRGMKQPVALYSSRENNLVPFSLLENETSQHTVVLGDSGSGKNVFVYDWIQCAKRLSPEPNVFIIGKKFTEERLANFFEADLTIFDRNQEIPFSPFRGVYDEEKIAFLTKFLISAVTLISPQFVIESEHRTVITKALKLAYLKKSQRAGLSFKDGDLVQNESKEEIEISMEDFIAELSTLDEGRPEILRQIVEPLISKLRPFYNDGMYAPFLRGSNKSPSGDKRFFIYDLDSLDSDPILQSLMTMAVTEEVRRIISLPQNQGRMSFLVFDEFEMLGRNNPTLRDYAIDFAETMRKKKGWLYPLTPRPENYFDSEVGRAFWGVADNFVFLQMSSDNVDYLAEKSSLMDEANKEIIRSLETKAGKYSEVFYTNKKKTLSGSFRFCQTKADRWISQKSCDGSAEEQKAYQNTKGSMDELLKLIDQKGELS